MARRNSSQHEQFCRKRRLFVEQLEDRRLLASDAAIVLESDLLAGHTLRSYPHVDQSVVEAFAAFDARRSEVPKVATPWLGLEDLNILGTPNLQFKHDGELLLNVNFSLEDQSFRDHIASTGVEIYSESDPPGDMYVWASFSQLDSLSQLNGVESVQAQRRASNDSGSTAFTAGNEKSDILISSEQSSTPAVASSIASPSFTPLSVALPFGPDYQALHPCGDSQCLTVPELLGAAMLPDGTLRLVGSSANFNPSPLTVWDVNSQGEIIRQLSLPADVTHVKSFIAGSAVSISPDGQWVAVNDEVFQIEAAEAPQVIPRPDDLPIGAQIAGRVANGGRVIFSTLGKSYVWDAVSGLKRLDSLFASDPEANSIQLETGANAISVNGNTISGFGYTVVGDSGLNGDFGHATVWDDFGPHALPDLGHPSSALAISGDGHIIGGEIRGVGAAVWIDWRLKALVDEQGNPLNGTVTSIVTGFSGYSGAWAAFGTAAGKPFVAFDDGVAHPLSDWLDQRYGIELSDESLMGAFYHDGALSLVTAQYDSCAGSLPDPINCSMSPPTQLAAHLTVVPVSDGVGNEDSSRPAPFTAHLPQDSMSGNMAGTIVPTADGFRALGFVGNETVVNEYDRAGQITSTIHLAPPPGQTFGVSQFSDDGLWVKGQAFTPTDSITVYWNLEHPDQPLTEEQLDASSRPSFSTAAASADGRVVVRGAESSTYHTVAIQVDGVVHEIRDASGAPIVGQVDHLFAGIGGVATRWIAVGQYVAAGGYTDSFIAFSDGSMMRLWDFIHDQWPTDDYVDTHYINVAVNSGSILFIDSTFSGPNCSGLVCGNVMIFTGFAVTSIPLPEKWVSSPLDVDNDSHVVATDALAVINYLTDHGAGPSANVLGTHSKYDINDDGFVSPLDVLLIINSVNASERAAATQMSLIANGGEGEAATTSSLDELFAAADTDFQSLLPRRRLIGS